MAFTQAQLDYVRTQVEDNPGFLFRDAGENVATGKFYLNFTAPSGRDYSLHEAIKKNKDWLTNDEQFRAVVADAISWMVRHFSDL